MAAAHKWRKAISELKPPRTSKTDKADVNEEGEEDDAAPKGGGRGKRGRGRGGGRATEQ